MRGTDLPEAKRRLILQPGAHLQRDVAVDPPSNNHKHFQPHHEQPLKHFRWREGLCDKTSPMLHFGGGGGTSEL